MKTLNRFRYFLAMAVMAALLAGCGYHFSGKSGKMPGDIKSLHIPIFDNKTRKPDIEQPLTQAFASEFARTVDVGENAEAILHGSIRSYDLKSVSYTKNDVNQEYRLTVVVSLQMVRREGGVVLWEDSSVADYGDFVVTLTDVTATREAEAEAFKKIARDTARLVKERMMENF